MGDDGVATIRCPHCGMLNHSDDIGFPLCGQCHEDLVRCGDCRHFQAGTCTHARERARFTPDQEAAKSCPAYHSRHQERDARLFTKLPAPLWVVSLLLIILGVLASLMWFIDPYGRYFFGNPLGLSIQVPRQVALQQPFQITIRITNELNVRSTPIYVEIGEEYLQAAALEMPYPQPRRIMRSPERLLLEYPPLNAKAVLPLRLSFVPTRPGVSFFVARIYAPSSHLSYEERVPISATGVVLPVQ